MPKGKILMGKKTPKAPGSRQRDYGLAESGRPMTQDQYNRYKISVKKAALNTGNVYGEEGGYLDYLSPTGYNEDKVVRVVVGGKIKTLPKYSIGPKRGPVKNVPKGYK